MLREAAPVGITLAIAVAYLKLDGVLLGILATPTDVGLYGAAYKLIEYPMLGLSVALAPLFPLLARWYAAERPHFNALYRGGLDGLAAVTLPLAIGAAFVGQSVLPIVYPREFVASATALTLLAVSLVFIMHNGWQGFSLLAAGFQRVTLAYDLGGLAVNVGLNLVLIPRYGFLGAAWAALGTSLFIAICSSVAAARLLGVGFGSSRLVGVVAANLGFASALWALLQSGSPWPVATLVAGLLYPLLLVAFRVARVAEIQSLFPSHPSLVASASGSSGL
jgi:O-antigen/teichoic acid export membrane protein